MTDSAADAPGRLHWDAESVTRGANRWLVQALPSVDLDLQGFAVSIGDPHDNVVTTAPEPQESLR